MRRATNLDVEWIDAGDGEPERPAAGSRLVRRVLILAAGVIVALIAVAVVDERAEPAPGVQLESPAVVTTSAEFRAWRVLEPADGSQRDGWPRPMISTGAEVCFGFENEAIGPPGRPSLARCVDRGGFDELQPSQLVSLITIRAGLDVWHVLMTNEPVTSVEFRTVAGESVGDDRVHVDGRIVAVRLAIAEPIGELTWSIGRMETRCVPQGDVNDGGRFCPGPGLTP